MRLLPRTLCALRYALCFLQLSPIYHFSNKLNPIGPGLMRIRFVPEEIEFENPIAATVENHINRHVGEASIPGDGFRQFNPFRIHIIRFPDPLAARTVHRIAPDDIPPIAERGVAVENNHPQFLFWGYIFLDKSWIEILIVPI